MALEVVGEALQYSRVPNLTPYGIYLHNLSALTKPQYFPTPSKYNSIVRDCPSVICSTNTGILLPAKHLAPELSDISIALQNTDEFRLLQKVTILQDNNLSVEIWYQQ
jgi:hypothetical protein